VLYRTLDPAVTLWRHASRKADIQTAPFRGGVCTLCASDTIFPSNSTGHLRADSFKSSG
jgi:hypothetical protein